MSTKPQPDTRRLSVETLRVYASRRMLWLVAMVTAALLVPSTTATVHKQLATDPQVPTLESTTDARAVALQAVLGGLPRPGPNQKRSGQCKPERSEVELNGGCWVQTNHPLPCPEGYQWEHEGRCWLPVAHAKPVPQAGEQYRANIAGEE